jgi:hypothetical protein
MFLTKNAALNAPRINTDTLCVGPPDNNWCFSPDPNKQWLSIARNNAPNTPDQGRFYLSHDGNIWVNKSNYRGWISDNIKALSDSTVRK